MSVLPEENSSEKVAQTFLSGRFAGIVQLAAMADDAAILLFPCVELNKKRRCLTGIGSVKQFNSQFPRETRIVTDGIRCDNDCQ